MMTVFLPHSYPLALGKDFEIVCSILLSAPTSTLANQWAEPEPHSWCSIFCEKVLRQYWSTMGVRSNVQERAVAFR